MPSTDSIFSASGSGRNYGYLAFLGTEFTADGLTVNAQPSTFAFTGITAAPKQWGRGPYNVAGTDASGTAGRLLVPFYDEDDDNHIVLFRTPVAPPAVTDGAVPLDIATKFVDPDFYFGGPASEPAADVAPEQDEVGESQNLTVTGVPDGGTFSLTVHYPGLPDQETDTIAYNASAADVKTALVALDDGYAAADWTTSGGALPGTAVNIIPPAGLVVDEGDNDLTGGTDPAFTVSDPA